MTNEIEKLKQLLELLPKLEKLQNLESLNNVENSAVNDVSNANNLLDSTANSVVNNTANGFAYDFIGKKVLVRAHRMGVNIGIVASVQGEMLCLHQSRKFWRWECKQGVALESFCADDNIKASGVKVSSVAKEVYIRLDDICGIITVSDAWYAEAMALPVAQQER